VAVDVIGASATDEPIGLEEEIQIVVGIPGSIGSDVDRGISPFDVVLSIQGLPSGVVNEVAWDLGDGGSAETLAVSHTYINQTGLPQTLPVSVTIETISDAGSVLRQTATRFITVDSEVVPVEEEEGTIVTATPQGQQTPQTGLCGAGAGAAMVAMLSLGFLRRRLH
jgi:hypothetical protein